VLTLLSIGGHLARPGAMRAVAEAIDAGDADIICVHGIDSGDALALATRFARHYAYRGAQALFWNERYSASEVQDRYLPTLPLRPFDRRGLLQVSGTSNGSALSIVATQFSREREGYVRELRFARNVLRRIHGGVILFAGGMNARALRVGFDDLQLRTAVRSFDVLTSARDAAVSASVLRV
jgi:hypothetical protein